MPTPARKTQKGGRKRRVNGVEEEILYIIGFFQDDSSIGLSTFFTKFCILYQDSKSNFRVLNLEMFSPEKWIKNS
ncbi:Transposase [Caenorhabditis elegans]|uniref:Transposase n=1 Tax=Caenorhabditis elegans TaxID=6239 RepID=Q94364_CAEEL|nr:Transposase [Caenorhabditis elegans]CAB03484.2 Transposase [Caenorhabditis elegans]